MHAFHIQNLNVKSPFNIRKEEIKPKDGTSRKCHSMIAKFTRYSLLVKQIIPLMSESLSRLQFHKERENSDDLTEYEVLGDGPEADRVLEGVPAAHLGRHALHPPRPRHLRPAHEGVVLVVR